MIRFFKRAEVMIVFSILAFAIGLGSAVYLPRQWKRSTALAEEPKEITLHELVANGPADDRHFKLSDYSLGSGYVFEMQAKKGSPPPTPDQTGWGRAWIPLFEKDTGDRKADSSQEPRNFVVLLETKPTVASGTGFHMLSRQKTVSGFLRPGSSLHSGVRDRLLKNYPDTDIGKCWVIEPYENIESERSNASALAYAMIVGLGLGILSIPIGIIGVLRIRRDWSEPKANDPDNQVQG